MNPPSQEEPEINSNTLIIENEELVFLPATYVGTTPTMRPSYFLKPSQNSTNTPHPPPIQNPPSQSLPSDIKNLSRLINFKGIKVPNDTWKTWVQNLISTHEPIWKKAGIFDAIRASTYVVKRDDELIIRLAHHWCPETNTFVFPWGECSITLEDVMVLGGFSVLGECLVNVAQSSEFDEINAMLSDSCKEIKRKNNYHVPFYEWIKYFKGKGGELEHVGLIVNWLSRYVFSVDQFDIDVNSFGFAISLARGNRIALAPAVLASIYRDLSSLKKKIVALNGGGDDGMSKLVLWAPLQLVQLWAWERFHALSPKPISLTLGQPRVARWDYVAKSKIDRVSLILELGVNPNSLLESYLSSFLWRPYAVNVENWELPRFYSDEGRWVVITEEADEELVSFARCLRVAELVGLDCVEQYLPHRVGLQFGMDQDIPDFVPMLNDDMKLAWSSYDNPLGGLELYLPPRLLTGGVTLEYSKLWRRISSVNNVETAAPEKKRKRKRESKSQKAKKAATSGEPQLCSRTSNATSGSQTYGSGPEISAEKLAPVRSKASETARPGDGNVPACENPLTEVDGTSMGEQITVEVNGSNGCLIDKDYWRKCSKNGCSQNNSTIAVSEAQSTQEPLQGPDTEKMCSVHKHDDMAYRGPMFADLADEELGTYEYI